MHIHARSKAVQSAVAQSTVQPRPAFANSDLEQHARKGCSGLLWRCQCPQNGRSRQLCFRQCAQKDCSSPLRCRQCIQSGCSRNAIQKCWSRLHCALSHCTLLCFAPCMYMHGSTLVYIYICSPPPPETYFFDYVARSAHCLSHGTGLVPSLCSL